MTGGYRSLPKAAIGVCACLAACAVLAGCTSEPSAGEMLELAKTWCATNSGQNGYQWTEWEPNLLSDYDIKQTDSTLHPYEGIVKVVWSRWVWDAREQRWVPFPWNNCPGSLYFRFADGHWDPEPEQDVQWPDDEESIVRIGQWMREHYPR